MAAFWPALTLLLAGLAVAACQQTPEMAPSQAPVVTIAQPVVRDVTTFNEFTGTTQAVESVEIRARVQGYLEQIAFRPSSFVEKGQLLFVIEREPFIAQRDRAAANLKSAEAALRRADSDLERLEQAVKTNAVSQQEVTRARAERDQAEAALLGARAALQNAQIELGYTTVESPIQGMVGRNLVDVGNLVGSGGSTLLTTVRRINPIYAYFEVHERLIAQSLDQRGGHKPEEMDDSYLPATLRLADTDLEVEGHVDYVDNTVEPSTGTIQLRAVFPNPDARLFPGFFVRLRLAADVLENATLILEKAVGADLGGKYVYVLGDDNVVEQRYVELGPVQNDGTVVVISGLGGDERYIVDGMLRARPGLPVTPQPAEGS